MSILIWLFFTIFSVTYSQAEFSDDFLQLPQNNVVKENIKELFLQIYTRANPSGARVNLTEGNNLTSFSSFNTNLKTFIFIHGWEETITKPRTILIKDSLLNASDANVLLLSWDKCATSINYFVSWQCVEGAGNYLGKFLENLQKSYNYSLDDVTIVGHSLGAHIAGYTGKTLNGTLAVIVGLDPAGPFFLHSDKNHRLDKTDAKYVQAIHTCATGIVGETYSVGTSDFWPNSGAHQPGCGLDIFECPHVRSIYYYAESVVSGGFLGWNCHSYEDFKHGKCLNGSKSFMGGLNVDKSAKGNYYLDTNDKSPFAKGDA